MSHGYPRLSGEEISMGGKSYPTHATIPLDEYSEMVKMLYKLLRKTNIPSLDDDIWEIIDMAQDLIYKEEDQ